MCSLIEVTLLVLVLLNLNALDSRFCLQTSPIINSGASLVNGQSVLYHVRITYTTAPHLGYAASVHS